MDARRTLLIGDLHSGHKVGLTPPQWWGDTSTPDGALRKTLWNAFADKVDELRPIDTVVVNGDCIDGPGKRSGGVELLNTSQLFQTDLAAEAINFIDAKNVVITRGTPYHVGNQADDYEDLVAEKTNAKAIDDQLWVDINGVILDCKHTISGSGVPHGKGLALMKAWLWNRIHHDYYESQPRADVFCRSHVHWYIHIDGSGWMGFVLPALQGLGSKFGKRQCEGLVNFGMVWLDIEDRETWIREPKWGRWLLTGGPQKASTLIL